jgi:hypothetical protein
MSDDEDRDPLQYKPGVREASDPEIVALGRVYAEGKHIPGSEQTHEEALRLERQLRKNDPEVADPGEIDRELPGGEADG